MSRNKWSCLACGRTFYGSTKSKKHPTSDGSGIRCDKCWEKYKKKSHPIKNYAVSKKVETLPIRMEDLQEFIVVGKAELKKRLEGIKGIDKIKRAHFSKEAALVDTQRIAEILLEAEKRMGEMLLSFPKDPGGRPSKNSLGSQESFEKRTKKKQLSELGIKESERNQAETLAKNPDEIEKVKAEAKEKKFIPTAHQIYNRIKKREKEKKDLKVDSDTLIYNEFVRESMDFLKNRMPLKIRNTLISKILEWAVKNGHMTSGRREVFEDLRKRMEK